MIGRLAVVQNRVGIGGRSKVLAEAIKALSTPETRVDVLTVSKEAEFSQFLTHYELRDRDIRHRQYAESMPVYTGMIYEQTLLSYLIRDDLRHYDFVFNSNNSIRFLPETPTCLNYIHQPIPAIPEITPRYRDSAFLKMYSLPMQLFEYIKAPPNIDGHPAVTNSAFLSEYFTKHFERQPDGVVYPPCIDSVACGPQAESGVVSLGAFHPNKRQLFQIEIAEELPDVEFTLIGRKKSDEYFERCERRIQERDVENVTLMPNASKDTVEQALDENRLFLHVMQYEEFGISIVEAMNHGCIPIVHDSGGPREIVTDENLRFDTRRECIDAIRTYGERDPDMLSEFPEHLEQFTTERFRNRIRELAELEPVASSGVRSIDQYTESALNFENGNHDLEKTLGDGSGRPERVVDLSLPVGAEPLSVGVVGAGFAATNIHLPLIVEMPETELSYVADIDRSTAKHAGRQYGTDWYVPSDPNDLPRTDAVVLTVPVHARSAYIESFGDRGIPIFVEKPFALTPTEHRRFDSVDVPVLCNYMRTCFSTTRQLSDIVDAGVFGELTRVEFREEGKVHRTDIPSHHYQADTSMKAGGILAERGSHVFSQLFDILGRDIEVMDASIKWNDGLDSAVITTLDSDAVAEDITVRLSRTEPIGDLALFEFERGTASFDPGDPSSQVTLQYGEAEETTVALEPEAAWATSNHQAAYVRWQQFLSLICGKGVTDCLTEPGITEMITQVYGREEER